MRTAHMAAARRMTEPRQKLARVSAPERHYADAPAWGEVSEVSYSPASVAAWR